MSMEGGRRPSQGSSRFSRGIGLYSVKLQTLSRALMSVATVTLALVGLFVAGIVSYLLPYDHLWDAGVWSLSYILVDLVQLTSTKLPVLTQNGTEYWPAEYVRTSEFFYNRAAEAWLVVGLSVKWASISAGLLALTAFVVFRIRGRNAHEEYHLRGQRLAEPAALARLIRRKRQDSWLKVGGVPLIKDTDTRNTLAVGTQGVGKSVLIVHLLRQIQDQGHAVIVYDRTGELLSQFYDPERGDVILNPLDRKSSSWSPWNEVLDISD